MSEVEAYQRRLRRQDDIRKHRSCSFGVVIDVKLGVWGLVAESLGDGPKVLLLETPVNPSPTAPPMMLSPPVWEPTSGKVANRRPPLVRGPVATSQGQWYGCAMRALRAATIALNIPDNWSRRRWKVVRAADASGSCPE